MNTFQTFLGSKAGRLHNRKQWAVRFEVTPSFVAHLASGIRRPSLETAFIIERETEGVVTMQSWLQAPSDVSLPKASAEAAPAP